MKYNLILIMAISLFALVLGGCATSSPGESTAPAAKASVPTAEAQMAAFEKTYAEVETLQKKANSVGGEWRDVGKFMKEAKAAAKEGNFDKASKLLAKAKFQSEAGYKQAMEQKGAGPQF